MTVAELIEILTEFDPEFEVLWENENGPQTKFSSLTGVYQDSVDRTVTVW